MRKAATFSGVELLGYCVLSTHFHVLVRVDPKARNCDDATLVERFRALYGEERAQCVSMDADELALLFADPARAETAEKLRAQLRERMGDVSAFMATLKQRYSKWFNRAYSGSGTLWAERFRSVLVEDRAGTLRLVAAYIDLNAVRAGLVEDPKDYAWCSYAAALGGDKELRKTYHSFFAQAQDAAKALANYRLYLLGKGQASKRGGGGGRVSGEIADEARRRGGRLPTPDLLRLRLTQLSSGLVVGSRGFVESILQEGLGLRYRRKHAPKTVCHEEDADELTCARQWGRNQA
jgi:putative transposase